MPLTPDVTPDMTLEQLRLRQQYGPKLPGAIDHTLLMFGADQEPEQAILALCDEAIQYGFAAVCVRPTYVALAKKLLVQSSVKVATVIGFPQGKVDRDAENLHPTVGDVPTALKRAEVIQALADGADELDVVLNVRLFQEELQAGTESPQTIEELITLQQAGQGKPLKVIIETDLLHTSEVDAAVKACVKAGVAMVKTCTGMVNQGRGATPALVRQIRATLDGLGATATQIKASGGIRTPDQALALLEAGANRLGTSSGIALTQGLNSTTEY